MAAHPVLPISWYLSPHVSWRYRQWNWGEVRRRRWNWNDDPPFFARCCDFIRRNAPPMAFQRKRRSDWLLQRIPQCIIFVERGTACIASGIIEQVNTAGRWKTKHNLLLLFIPWPSKNRFFRLLLDSSSNRAVFIPFPRVSPFRGFRAQFSLWGAIAPTSIIWFT